MPEERDFRREYEGITDLKTLALKFKELQGQRDVLKAQAAELWWEMEFLTKTLLPELMDEETLIKFADFPYKLQKKSDIYAGCIGGVTEEVKDWLFENDGAGLVKDTVNSSSLKAWMRKRLLDGKPIPQDLFKIEPYDTVSIVKA